jgi:hypothetical protein
VTCPNLFFPFEDMSLHFSGLYKLGKPGEKMFFCLSLSAKRSNTGRNWTEMNF